MFEYNSHFCLTIEGLLVIRSCLRTLNQQFKVYHCPSWAELFSENLNRPDPENPPDITPASDDLDISTNPPTQEEIIKVIKPPKRNETLGQDAIKAELFKINPELAADTLLLFLWVSGRKMNSQRRLDTGNHR